MTTRIGINGFGRIGRLVQRQATRRGDFEIALVNDLVPSDNLAYLMKYDSTHGKWKGTVEIKDGKLCIDGNAITCFTERDPTAIKWGDAGAVYVVESTGVFTTIEKANAHIQGGAKKVIVSAPSADAPMFVMGVNSDEYTDDLDIVSNLSLIHI